ncbi:addiction module toxin, HicA family [Mesorhizobium sp. B2-7-1]|nr:addiction module toxin, HicA family [Mesorhizobium sp. B2-7-1]
MSRRDDRLLLSSEAWRIFRLLKPVSRGGHVTVAGKPSDVTPGTLNSILKQSGLKE